MLRIELALKRSPRARGVLATPARAATDVLRVVMPELNAEELEATAVRRRSARSVPMIR